MENSQAETRDINQTFTSGIIESFEEVARHNDNEYLDFTLKVQNGKYVDYIRCGVSKDNVAKALVFGKDAKVIVSGTTSCRRYMKDGEEKNGFQKINVFQIEAIY